MANYSALKTTIGNAIRTNSNNEITGQLLQSVLNAMVTSLGNKFQIAGVATTTDNPGTPDYNVAYIAGPGRYVNFGGLTVPGASIGLLCYNGSWTLQSVSLSGLQNGYAFLGVLQPAQTLPTVPGNSFFLCGQGTYGNAGTVAADELGVLMYASVGGWALNRIAFSTGSTVRWDQIQTSGVKIAEISIDGTTTEIFAPTPSAAENFFENVNNAASLKSIFTAGITTPQGDIKAPAGVVFGKSSGKITVGTGGDFNTLSAALAYASKFSHIFNNSGNTLTIEIQSGFPIGEQLVIDGIDLSYVNVTLQGYTPPEVTLANAQSYLTGQTTYPTVLIDLINNQTFMTLRNGARGPRISCIMRAVASRNVTGIVLEGGSEIHIDPFCGLETFRSNFIVASDGSRVIARGGILKGATNVQPNLIARSGSFIAFPDGLFSRTDAGSAVTSFGGSHVVVDDAFIRCTGEFAATFYADRAFVSATGLNLINSTIEAYAVGGEINIGANSATIPVQIESGGIIRVVVGTPSTSDPLNTLTANGVIFA